MPKRHDNTIYKPFFGSKTIKVILNNIIRTKLIIHIKDPKEAPSVNYIHIEEDTKVEETTIADIVTSTYPIKSNIISVINLDANQANIQQKRDNKYILNINNMPNIQKNRRLY